MNRYPIIVRVDDVCPTMNFDKFNKFIELFDEINVTPLLGIVPACQDLHLMKSGVNSDFYHMINELIDRGYEISMHGYTHVMEDHGGRALLTSRKTSEFSGLTYERQKELLDLGKRELERHGLFTDIFMPPAHSYDINTIKALRSVGFTTVSDGMSLSPYTFEGIKFVPADSSFRLHKVGLLTLCIHAESDDFERIAFFLRKYRNRIITFKQAQIIKEISYKKARRQEKIRLWIRHIIFILYRCLKSEGAM